MHRAKYRILGRSITELDARKASPANPNLPPSSVPVAGPVVGSLLGNGNGGGKGGGGGGGNGGGGGGDGNGGRGGGGNGGGSSDGGSGNGGGSSSGGLSTPITASPTSGGGNAVPPASILPSPTPPDPVPANPTSLPSAEIGSGPVASPSSPGNSAGIPGAGNGQSFPVNVASAPSTSPGALGVSAPVALATGPSLPSMDSLGSSNTLSTAASSPTVSTTSAVTSGKHLSAAAITGITIMCLLFLLILVLLVIRRRSIAHRVELRKQWWFSRNASGGNPRSSVGSNGEVSASRLTARSSFATNFDQGLMFRPDSPRFSLGVVPDLPPMAEVRERNSVLISTGGSVARRESLNSMLSNGSESDAQYLTVSTGQNSLEPSTPMSVRPFSPSESFAFPKPPAPSSTINTTFIPGSPQSSTATLIHLIVPPRAFTTDPPSGSASMSLYPHALTPSATPSPCFAASDPFTDVFADPVKPEFSDIEVIRRPFIPTLDDELAVRPGDRVYIFRTFDDGWAFVEKVVDTASERNERGLIPVDCFRQIDQSLPTFLVEKRVSYVSESVIGTAL